VAYSHIASLAGGGEQFDYVYLMKLPKGAYIVGGWLYTEDGLGDDNDVADLGIVYENGDGTDDEDCLIDGLDVYDGADTVAIPALPAGSIHLIGTDVEAFPFGPLEGEGTVKLTNMTGDFKTAKDVKCWIYYVVD
jgi:hypothetical protein